MVEGIKIVAVRLVSEPLVGRPVFFSFQDPCRLARIQRVEKFVQILYCRLCAYSCAGVLCVCCVCGWVGGWLRARVYARGARPCLTLWRHGRTCADRQTDVRQVPAHRALRVRVRIHRRTHGDTNLQYAHETHTQTRHRITELSEADGPAEHGVVATRQARMVPRMLALAQEMICTP